MVERLAGGSDVEEGLGRPALGYIARPKKPHEPHHAKVDTDGCRYFGT
jgi:hypothetical protein